MSTKGTRAGQENLNCNRNFSPLSVDKPEHEKPQGHAVIVGEAYIFVSLPLGALPGPSRKLPSSFQHGEVERSHSEIRSNTTFCS